MTAARYELHVPDGAPTVVVVAGELDVTNVSDFVVATEKVPGERPVVLDLTGVSYVDSAGLATLDRLTGTHTAVVVLPPTSPTYRAAALMDLPCHDTVPEAIAALREG